MNSNPGSQDAALDWIVRTNDPDFDAWDDFTDWLEADPANATAYHRLAESEAMVRPVIADLGARPTHRVLAAPIRRMRPRVAIAASVAALAAVATVMVGPRLMPVHHSTVPGEMKIVSLGGQDQIILNGDTKLTLSGLDRRQARLDQGQVYLRLVDPGDEGIDLRSGDLRLVDVGTMFEVTRDGQSTRVVVSEGAVMADPDGAKLRLSAGQKLETQDGAPVLMAAEADLNSVGGFQRGQLLYADEPLDRVLADLRRSTGIAFSTSGTMSARRFTGTLSVAEVKRDPQSLEPLLGVTMRKSDRGWTVGVRE